FFTSLWNSFRALPAGCAQGRNVAAIATQALDASGSLISGAFCMGFPAAVAVLALDLAVSVSMRALPSFGLPTLAAPLRGTLGLAALFFTIPFISGRLVSALLLAARLAHP